MKVVLIGPPGAGKGTLANLLAQRDGFATFSTGDALRDEIKTGSELGQQIDELISNGFFVPNNLSALITKQAVERNSGDLILDGFPRNLEQVRLFEQFCVPDLVLYLETDKETIMKRLLSRRVCSKCSLTYNLLFADSRIEDICDNCGGNLIKRPDDDLIKINIRLEIYQTITLPIVTYYQQRQMLKTIDGRQSPEQIYNQVKNAVDSRRKLK